MKEYATETIHVSLRRLKQLVSRPLLKTCVCSVSVSIIKNLPASVDPQVWKCLPSYLIICFKILKYCFSWWGQGHNFPMWWRQFSELIKRQKEPSLILNFFPKALKALLRKEIFFRHHQTIQNFTEGLHDLRIKLTITISHLCP